MSATIDAQKDPLHKLFKMMLQHFLTAAIHDLTSFQISFNWPSDPRNTIYTLAHYFLRTNKSSFKHELIICFTVFFKKHPSL